MMDSATPQEIGRLLADQARPPAHRTPPAEVSRWDRWRLTEPARLYLWPVAVLALLGAGIAAGVGEWLGAALLAAVGLLVALAAAAVRASVFCTRSMVQSVTRARQ